MARKNEPKPRRDQESVEECLNLLRQMLTIRAFEERIQGLFTRDLIRASTHLCNGQEAVAVGACSSLSDGDTMTCTYRGHGAVLAMGAPLEQAFAEVLGRAAGLCKGKGGSMHLTDVSVGALGSFAIVGSHLPISAGVGLASKLQGNGAANLCFFGDGATNIGAFHEALNLAGVWRLPVVFICENNLYGEYSPMALTTPIERLADRASAYGMPGQRIDGNDVFVVREAVGDALVRARKGDGPTLIEAITYRHKGHSRTDPATYRPAGELEEWLERDPVARLEERLRTLGVGDAGLAEARAEVESLVDRALEAALHSPEPAPDERYEDVWA